MARLSVVVVTLAAFAATAVMAESPVGGVPLYDQCGGSGGVNWGAGADREMAMCEPGSTCVRQDALYWQCLPVSDTYYLAPWRACKTPMQLAAEMPELSTFLAAVQATGLTYFFNNIHANMTVFIPTNQAFADIGAATIEDGDDLLKLAQVLQYHVLPGALQTWQYENGLLMQTMLRNAKLRVNLDDGKLMAIGSLSRGNIVEKDLMACKSVVQVIDSVLLPNPTFLGA